MTRAVDDVPVPEEPKPEPVSPRHGHTTRALGDLAGVAFIIEVNGLHDDRQCEALANITARMTRMILEYERRRAPVLP